MAQNQFDDLSQIEQIAIVTGLFDSEEETVRVIGNVSSVASEFGFDGTIFFFGSEIRTREALKTAQSAGLSSFCYALDCFTDRERRLNKRKGNYPVDKIMGTISYARELGLETTFAYIVGMDTLSVIQDGIVKLSPLVNRFPIVNIFQRQVPEQTAIMSHEANCLNYFLKAREIFEDIFENTSLRPHNWENYRSLWTHYFRGHYIPE